MRLAARWRGLRRFMPISRMGGAAGGGARVAATSNRCPLSTLIWIGISTETRNARPASVISQPASSRKTNDWLKISRSGARAAKRFVRSVQSEPLEIRIATARLRSASEARP